MLARLLDESGQAGRKLKKRLLNTNNPENYDFNLNENEDDFDYDCDYEDDNDVDSALASELNTSSNNTNNTNTNDIELTMDGLPESTRFTTSLRMSSNELVLSGAVDAEKNEDLDNDSENNNFEADNMTQIGAYVQKNSRLKMILLSADILDASFSMQKTIEIVSYYHLKTV